MHSGTSKDRLMGTDTKIAAERTPMERPSQVKTIADVIKSSLLQTKGLINGEWVDGATHSTFSVFDPATQQEITRVASMDKTDVEVAIKAAAHAQREWKKCPPLLRAALLKSWYQQIHANKEELASITSAESGKPLAEALAEVIHAASFIEYFAGACMQPTGFVVPTDLEHRMIAVPEPVGVCGIITPWSFPLAMVTQKLAPCLAAGCTAVVHPSSETPLSALALVELAQRAGIPAGVINVVLSPHETSHEVCEALAASNAIRKLSFAGSRRVGQLLMQQSASTVKRLSLELGGNAAFIVFGDADLDEACAGLMAAKFRNNGQTGVCSNRVFVHSSVFEEFLHKLVKQVKRLTMGSPFSLETQVGPLINVKTFKNVESIVQDAVEGGAAVATGGKPATMHGKLYYEPTVLVDVNEDMRVYYDEIFGPVIPLYSFDDESVVVDEANATKAGLAAYFYTRDVGRAWRVAGALEVGMVGVNAGLVTNAQAPFGGVKQSGIGREGSMLGLAEYLETKLINMGGIQL